MAAPRRPSRSTHYTLFHIVGDMVELVKALGEEKAVVVGHDWGAPVAWHCALLRPDMFRAVVRHERAVDAARLRSTS